MCISSSTIHPIVRFEDLDWALCVTQILAFRRMRFTQCSGMRLAVLRDVV